MVGVKSHYKLAGWLKAHGVELVYGLPGEENLHLIDSIIASGIKFIRVDHEASAGFLASTYARLTGKLGVMVTTLGPGATNAVTPVAQAQMMGIPLLIVTADKPFYTPHSRFQEVDLVNLFKPITNFSHRIESPSEVLSTFENGYKAAMGNGRKGVAHIQLPVDISDLVVPDTPIVSLSPHQRPVLTPESIHLAKQLLSKSKHPLVISALGACHTPDSESLSHSLNSTQICFISTAMGKGAINENYENYLGTVISEVYDPLQKAINYADLIICLGYDTHERPFSLIANGDKNVISISEYPQVSDAIFAPDIELVGPISSTLSQLLTGFDNSLLDNSYFHDLKKLINAPSFSGKQPPMHNLVERISSNLRPTDRVVLDNGMYKWDFARHMRCAAPNQLLLDNALATMGGGIASGVSASSQFPASKVITVIGDGGYLMSTYDLGIMKRLAHNMRLIILQNNKYGMISAKQKDLGLKENGVSLQLPDMGKIAEGYGIPYREFALTDFESLDRFINEPGLGIAVVEMVH